MFGLPLVDIAFGATHSETRGTARGVFAIGDRAKGVIAIGGSAFGVVAIGGRAIGVVSIGGIAIGVVSSWGGISVAALASGGLVLGLVGFGGLCAALVASGGISIGLYAAGGLPIALASSAVPAADVFSMFEWFLGPLPPTNVLRYFTQPMVVTLGLPLLITTIVGLMSVLRLRRASR